jgi:diguanylate cyclase (GGDEF)-like protein
MKTSSDARSGQSFRTGDAVVVGDAAKAFSPEAVMDRLQFCEGTPEAIGAADFGHCRCVFVVMGGLSCPLRRALGLLRQKGAEKIVLLARMHEEPEALELVRSQCDEAGFADEYLICPVGAEDLQRFLLPQTDLAGGAAAERIRQLEKLAVEDELTGLKNRRYIWEFAGQIIELAKKQQRRVTVLVFDIDDFKHYNDLYGHSTGDEILKQAALLMSSCCRGHDVVGRIGGDEFAVVFWDYAEPKDRGGAERRSAVSDHPSEAVFIAERFRSELGKTELGLLGPGGEGVLTISGGLASFPRDGSTVEELFEQADRALLEAKRSGKNRIYLVGEGE